MSAAMAGCGRRFGIRQLLLGLRSITAAAVIALAASGALSATVARGGDCIPGGLIDPWPDALITCHQFGVDPINCPANCPGGNCSPPIPADFFGPGSDPRFRQFGLPGRCSARGCIRRCGHGHRANGGPVQPL